MASGGKRKTTMAKLMRESRLRERRQDKQARKDARKRASAEGAGVSDETMPALGPLPPDAEQLDPGTPVEHTPSPTPDTFAG